MPIIESWEKDLPVQFQAQGCRSQALRRTWSTNLTSGQRTTRTTFIILVLQRKSSLRHTCKRAGRYSTLHVAQVWSPSWQQRPSDLKGLFLGLTSRQACCSRYSREMKAETPAGTKQELLRCNSLNLKTFLNFYRWDLSSVPAVFLSSFKLYQAVF